jgi:hypothetical protein
MATRDVNGRVPFRFIDDAARTDHCRNGQPAHGQTMESMATFLNQIAYAGRPLFNWWGSDWPGGASPQDVIRQVVMRQQGAVQQRTAVHALRPTGALAAGQGLFSGIDGVVAPAGTDVDEGYASLPSAAYPADVVMRKIVGEQELDERFAQVRAGNITANGPQLRSGVYGEAGVQTADDTFATSAIAGTGRYVAQGKVVAVDSSVSSIETVTRFRDRFNEVWMRRRPQIGWNIQAAGAGATSIQTLSTDWRYIFDNSIGDGGVAPSATGPGITLPLKYAGSGLRTQVRVIVCVYARMSGTTDTGTVGIANKNASGTMGAFAALTNPVTITGNTFAWYPTIPSNTAPESMPYFNGYCGPASEFDRVLIGFKTSGATDSVDIGGFSLIVCHSA